MTSLEFKKSEYRKAVRKGRFYLAKLILLDLQTNITLYRELA